MALAVLLLAPACADLDASEEDPPEDDLAGDIATTAATTDVALRPTRDVSATSVIGVGDTSALFRNVDDGTSFTSSDGGATVVRAATGVALARHRVGYSGAPAGTVTAVTVRYRARRSNSAGTAQMKLYAGTTLVGTGALRTLTDSFTSYTDTFTGLSVADANQLATEIELRNTRTTGSHRYTIVWITVSVAGGDEPAPGGAGPFLPYTATSFFRTPLPAAAPLDAESDDGIAFIKSHPEQVDDYPLIRGLGTNKWGTVYFEGSCSDPVWTLTGTVPADVAFLKTQGFHAPALLGETFTGTNDSPFVVMDRCGVAAMPAGLSVWAANAARGPGYTISVSAAGAFQHDSNGLDRRNPRSTSTKNFRSRGAIPDAMVIRKDRLEWAIANDTDLGHVLHMFWVETDTGAGHVHPMIGHEGEKYGWGAEGIRIRIKPSVNLATRGLSPGGLVVARTLQRYGAYLGDNSGSVSALKAEQDHGQWGNLLTDRALRGLTWDDFEFVERGWQP